MEHWGAITFRENYLLFDPRKDAPSARRGIFALIAHEIAHQWFGNLVTMTWWDNLWLNEGFATWMESKATEHFHPRWQTWLNNYDEKQGTMRQDANGTAHADPAGRSPTSPKPRRCSTTLPTTRPAPSSACWKAIWAPRCSAPACANTSPIMPMATPRRPTCGARSKPSPASR